MMSNAAEWCTAFGTILLSFVTVWITYCGDSATRLLKNKMNYDFEKIALKFLNDIIQHPERAKKISKEFYYNPHLQEMIIYLSRKNTKRLKKYVEISRQLEKEWVSGNDNTQCPIFESITSEIKELSESINDPCQTL
jgi:spermidine/putrescine-binding protein